MSLKGAVETLKVLRGKVADFFVIDKSLSISGACADAKAVGDALKNATSRISVVEEEQAIQNNRVTAVEEDQASQSDRITTLEEEQSNKFQVLFNTKTVRPQGSEITIPNAKLYNHFELHVSNAYTELENEGLTTPIYAIRHNNYIHGNGVFVASLDSGKTPMHFYFSATTRDVSSEEENQNAEIWSIDTLSYMPHTPGDAHAFITNAVDLIEVIGVI